MPQLDVFTLFAQSLFTFLSFYIFLLYFRGFVLSEIFSTLKLHQFIISFLLKFSEIFSFEIINIYIKFLNFVSFSNINQYFVLNIYKN